jgi:methyltransferase-like protein/2-polyprenyl-3-methyl-5-hydroxy-6-metoxy-1,4-benzoquinol methylase
MTDKVIESAYVYDEVPYPSYSFNSSHPDHLATLATLLGMRPPPVEHCRVLELGCASGGNITPMAQSLPRSEFVGIDLSACEIAEGQAMIAAVGLKNVTLKQMNILDVGPDFGHFDYIIAHGVYSWVPAPVQDKILELCQQHLAPNGVAYISYNTYPGWHMLGTIRDIMLYHTRQVSDPREQAAQARALLDFLAKSLPEENTHSSFLKVYIKYINEYIAEKPDAFIVHDELSEVNEPIYFYQFAERAARHGLQYLAEADFSAMLASNFPAEVAETLRQMARDTIAVEQYMDFLRNRTFRKTLLCHEDIQLSGSVKPERLAEFYVASPALPVSDKPDIHSTSVEQFRAGDGAILSTDHPVTKAGMLYLSEIWPQTVPFNTLLAEARARLNGASAGQQAMAADADPPEADTGYPAQVDSDVQVLGANLLQAFGYSDCLVELHVYAPPFVLEVSELPRASPVALFQAQKGNIVTNLRHERIALSGMSYHLLRHLDGSRDRAALLDALAGLVAAGVIEVRQDQDDEPVKDAEQARSILAERLDLVLHHLARAALLVG